MQFFKEIERRLIQDLKAMGVDELNYDCRVDTLVIGSDEVFNCLQPYPVGYSKQLFGDGFEGNKLVSYAASFGSTRYEDLVETGIVQEIKTMLSKFAAISVRDENSAHIVKQLLGYDPEIHMDPVLMYDFAQEIAEYKTSEKDYIILYAYTGRLSREEECYIKKFANRHNKKIICIGHYSNIADKNVICNPLYVFSYFKNADYVITDTFHGTVFSIKMNTKFCTLIRDSNRNKLEALLKKLDKLDRKVEKMEDSQLFLCDLRGKELLLKYSLGNILQTLMIAILNITFLLVFKMETGGYLLAYIIANFIVAIYAIIAGKGYKAFSFHNIDRCKLKEMIRYSVVLIPNTFMWWIMNSSDRVMVTYMIGAAANGIYAVSYKLPTLVSTLTGIFNQAWSYSAIREEGTRDETEYNNKMFKTLSAIAFMMGIGLLLLTKPFLRVYVADSYYDAWKYTPFLIVGCVYLTLGTFMATSYTVHKDSFGYLFSGSFGAVFNILLNFILIPVIGVYGAALATCISYIAVFMFRVFHTRKYIKYDILYKEFILGSLLMILSAILMFADGAKGFLLQFIVLVLGFVVFSKTWIPILQFFLNKIRRKRVI